MLWLLAMLGCFRAARPDPEPFWVGRFVVEVPQGWDVKRNARVLGNHHFLLTGPTPESSISVDLIRDGRQTRDLELRVVNETYALETGRVLGIESGRVSQHQLLVADREAWATTVRRRHGPNERIASIVTLRGDRHVAVLTLHTVNDAPASVVRAWDQVLSSFLLPFDAPESPAIFLQDTIDEDAIDAIRDVHP